MKPILTIASILVVASFAGAQVSQRNQQEAEQSASQAAVQENNEVSSVGTQAVQALEAVRDTSKIVVEAIADAVVGDAGGTETSNTGDSDKPNDDQE